MTDREYALLNFIQSAGRPSWTDVLNGFDPKDALENSAILNAMLGTMIKKTDKVSKPPLCRITLTDPGALALRAEREHRVKQALLLEENIRKEQSTVEQHDRMIEAEASRRAEEKRADRHFQYRLTFLQTALSFISGALLSNLDRIIEWIMSIF